jgi:hypothetical protein
MSFSERIHERRRTFKSTVDTDDARRRREDEAVQIRKKDKEEQMARRRRLVELSSDICVTNVCLDNVPIHPGMHFAFAFARYTPRLR